MGHSEGASRAQQVLFPAALEDYMADENPVRFIDAFVESLDLHTLGFRHVQPAATGRPAYHPGDLRKLYLDGYLNRMRSGRCLARETPRNVALLWLVCKLHPDFKTLADVRKDPAKACKQVFRTFVLLCKERGLFGQELVAIDGSKFNAVNNTRRNVTHAKLDETLQAIDASLEHYRHAWDAADQAAAEAQKPTADALRERIRQLHARKGGGMKGLRKRWRSAGEAKYR